jgi:hypothetical protein
MTTRKRGKRGLGWPGCVVGFVVIIGACSAAPTTPASSPAASAAAWPSPLTLGAIRDEITRRAGGELLDIGDEPGKVAVGLRARDEALAKQIVDAYGSAVDVRVGWLPYPIGTLTEQTCALDQVVAPQPSLRATVELSTTTVAAGDNFDATVRIENIGDQRIDVMTDSQFVVYMFRPGETAALSGGPDGGFLGTGLDFSLSPGDSRTIPGYGGTASCDPSVGYVLPAGPYDARALINISTETGPRVFWSDPSRLDVHPR